jgi:hypothetical protein
MTNGRFCYNHKVVHYGKQYGVNAVPKDWLGSQYEFFGKTVPRFHVPGRLESEQLLGPPSLHLEIRDDALALVAVELERAVLRCLGFQRVELRYLAGMAPNIPGADETSPNRLIGCPL